MGRVGGRRPAGDDGSPAPEPVPADVTQVLLEAKLGPPRARAGTIPRSRLIDALRSSVACPLVVISAPAGFGKTTVLADWAEQDDRTFVWVSLERGDGEPVALLTLLATAVARVRHVDPRLFDHLGSPGISVLGRVVPRLVAALRAPGDPVVLVLRGAEEITSRVSQDAVDLLVDQLPAGVQVVVTGRRAVWLASGTRRSGGALLELGPADLAFDVEEACALFEALGVGLPAAEVASLVTATEGWAAGLYLTALALRAGCADQMSAHPPHLHPFVSEYVRTEVLSQLAPGAARFLRRTAVLDVMSGPLCDAVLCSSGSAGRLESTSRSNLFLVPLDDRQDWYRMHSLFRAVLLDDLVRREPGRVCELHRRAADWWEAHGSVERAIHHALASGDPERSARLVADQIVPAYLAGRLPLVETWLREIGESRIERDASLAVLAGWVAALDGRPVDAARWADVADRAEPPAERAAWFESVRAMLRAAMCPNGIAAMKDDAQTAVRIEPVGSVWRQAAVGLLGVAHLLGGDTATAERYVDQAVDAAEASGARVPLVRWLAHRALLLMDRGHWSRAADDVERALAVVDADGLTEYETSALAYAAAARLALRRRDAEGVRVALGHAMRLRQLTMWALPWHGALLRLEMARVLLAIPDPGGAKVLLRELDQIRRHRPDLGVLNVRMEDLRERLRDLRGHGTVSTLTAAELRLLPYLQTHLTLAEAGQRLYVSRNTVASQASSIYRKLEVSSRGEAVARARQIGLLEPSSLE
ncbi:MAG: LuxR family transcriptional regulator [Acidimicrobiales bacterium]|nr:LuxR family transcriptional regulator [Acidimicrobiales bacterium]